MPFGLYNGLATFQRIINEVLFDILDNFCIAYTDDILIYSDDPSQYEGHVKEVLARLCSVGL